MRMNSFPSWLSSGSRLVTLLAAAALLSQCSSPVRESAGASRSDYMPAPATSARTESQAPAKSRPGLGTQLGHQLDDDSTPGSFYRKPSSGPDAVASFHYNSQEGAHLMASLEGRPARHDGSFDLIPEKLRVTVLEGSWYSGKALEHYQAGQGIFVIGSPGKYYNLQLENRTSCRMEVVVSVDGLSLSDGQPASVKKPGYIIPAKSSVVLRGMRVGGKLYSLKFGTVSDSRASTAFGQKGARNVGVVGVACYEEDERARRRAEITENYVRHGARAFGN